MTDPGERIGPPPAEGSSNGSEAGEQPATNAWGATKRSDKPLVSAEVLAKWQGITDLMAKTIGVPSALITRVDPPAIEILVASASPHNPYRRGGRVVFETAFKMYCQIVMTRRQSLYIPDARRHPDWLQWQWSPDVALGMTCYLGFPLQWPDGEMFGTICVMDTRDNPAVAQYQDLVRQFGKVAEDDLKFLVAAADRERAIAALRDAHADLERRVERRTAQVRQANARVAEVLESVTDAFTALDREWRFTYVNEQAAKNLGKTQQELLGQCIWDLFPEEVGREGYNLVERAMTERVPVHYEYYVASIGRWFDNHVYPTPEGVSIYSHDMTDRKRAEEGLRQANSKITEILESITDAFVALDREWRFTYVNERAAQTLGQSQRDLIGQNMWDLIPEMVGTEAYRLTHEAMAERRPVHYENFVPSFGRWYLTHAYPTRDGGLAVYGNDITDRKRAEDDLRWANAKVTEVLESITDVFVAFDREWRYTYVNERATQFLGRTREELLGRRVWDLFPEREDSPGGKLAHRAMVDRVPVHFENYVRRFRRWVETYAYPTREGVAMYVRDITDRKRAETSLRKAKWEAEEANRAKDQFIAVLSHELRTPLTPVLATVSAWESKADLPPDVRADARMLRQNVELEARLIDDLLDSTRLTRGKVELHRELTNVHECIRRAMDTSRVAARAKEIDLSANLQAREHHAWADPARLQQIFWNLLSNAIKFTPPGGSVRVTSHSASGRLQVEVADNGVGIEADAMTRIFNAFEQAEQTKARRFGGLGLGLTIAKNLVEMHEGRLSAFSNGKDKGATFTVYLATVTPAQQPKAPAPPAPSRDGAAGSRILLVEDDPDTLRVMSRLLKSLGYAVSPAENVRAALDAAARERFDLLISDLGLPDGSGLDVMREVKRRYGLKGLAISGYGTDDDVRDSREAGFQKLLTKPVTFHTLETTLRQMTTQTGAS